MKKPGLLLFCFIHLLAYGQTTKRVLFLGNSYTRVNNLPQLVANAAASVGDTLIFDSNTPDGYTLLQHFNDATSIAKIKAGGWDYVVMQEQSQLPAFEEYNDYPAYNLSSLIRKHNPCARILFYMTWGRKNGDASNCAAWPPICTYNGMDSLLRLRYTEMAILNETGLSPVGAAWRYVRENYPAINLYQTDESHPAPVGSYLAACCFYTTLFKKDPGLITYTGGLSTYEVTSIMHAVKKVVFDSLPQWDYGNYIPKAQFQHTIGNGNNEVIFTNTSTNADSTVWDFGDGTFSGVKNPVHQYATNGTYTVTLTAINCDLSVTHVSAAQATIRFCSHNPTVFPNNLLLCPNAHDTLWTQPYDAYQWIDSQGDTIPGETKRYFLPAGGNSYSVIALKNHCAEESPQVYVNVYNHLGTYYVTAFGNFIKPDTLCTGDTLMLIITPNKPPFPPDKIIRWYRDGVLIPASANDTLLATLPGEYKVKLLDTICPNFVPYESQPQPYTFINCGPTGIIENNALHNIRLYPNPASDIMQVHIPAFLSGSSYTINDMYGKLILWGKLGQEISTVNLNGISSGIYILHIQQQAIKFVKD